MSNTLNFNKVQKKYLTVTLADDKNTVLMIGTPTKSIFDDLKAMQQGLELVSDDEQKSEDIDALYEACAKIMRRNKMNKPISKEFLEEIFDIEDITIFFNAYMKFVDEAINSKN